MITMVINLSKQMSHEKRAPGWFGYIGDDILPSYIGIIINHYKDPHFPSSILRGGGNWGTLRIPAGKIGEP